MKIQQGCTGDVFEMPPPDDSGRSVIKFNGCIVKRVTYSDANGGSISTEDGRIFTPHEWSAYLVEQLRTGAWKVIN